MTTTLRDQIDQALLGETGDDATAFARVDAALDVLDDAAIQANGGVPPELDRVRALERATSARLDRLAEQLPDDAAIQAALLVRRERLANVAERLELVRAPDATPMPRRWVDSATIGRVLTVFGIIMVLFVVWELWASGLVAARSQQLLLGDLRKDLLVSEGAAATGPEVSGLLGGDENADEPRAAPQVPQPGSPVAVLRIPALDLQKVVVQGTAATELEKGPGHYRGTVMPGEPGNAAIAGHRTSYGGPFRRLDELERGDRIELTSAAGKSVYRVRTVKNVGGEGADPTAPTTDNQLTLITSNPAYVASERLVVVASLATDPVRPKYRQISVPDAAESGMGGDMAAKAQVVVWGTLFVLAFLLAHRLYRRWERWPTYLLTSPVLLVLLVLTFQSIDQLLPSTL